MPSEAMTDKATLIALAERVEKAEAGSRELDAEIEKMLSCSDEFARHHPGKSMRLWNENAYRFYYLGDDESDYQSPAYTTSLDAAMSLVPDGMVWQVLTDYGLPGRARISDIPRLKTQADGETPALALTAASLRAIAENI